jgi:hypothetical protein
MTHILASQVLFQSRETWLLMCSTKVPQLRITIKSSAETLVYARKGSPDSQWRAGGRGKEKRILPPRVQV